MSRNARTSQLYHSWETRKIVAVDAWSMEPRDRYLTLIVVGLVLLTVSFLYNRYREALRKLL